MVLVYKANVSIHGNLPEGMAGQSLCHRRSTCHGYIRGRVATIEFREPTIWGTDLNSPSAVNHWRLVLRSPEDLWFAKAPVQTPQVDVLNPQLVHDGFLLRL